MAVVVNEIAPNTGLGTHFSIVDAAFRGGYLEIRAAFNLQMRTNN
jgi:hypothetical protein